MKIVSESNVMLKIKTLLAVAIAVTGATLASSSYAQECSSCAQAAQFAPAQFAPTQLPFTPAPQVTAGPCTTCGPAVAPVQQVVYVPQQTVGCSGGSCGGGGGCLGGGCLTGGGVGGGLDELKAKCAHQKAINAKIAARNNAWPKPFDCADRQLYFSFFESMIDQGWEEQSVLTAAHFNESNQLNDFGITAVAGIMQNNPSNRRTVYINRDTNDAINQQRQSTVQNTINQYYGQTAGSAVAFSNKRPVTTSGTRAAQIQEQWFGGQAVPAIAVSTGGTVADSVSSN